MESTSYGFTNPLVATTNSWKNSEPKPPPAGFTHFLPRKMGVPGARGARRVWRLRRAGFMRSVLTLASKKRGAARESSRGALGAPCERKLPAVGSQNESLLDLDVHGSIFHVLLILSLCAVGVSLAQLEVCSGLLEHRKRPIRRPQRPRGL